MVIVSEIREGMRAVWVDGRIPSYEALVSGSNYRRLRDRGLDEAILKSYELDTREKRRRRTRTDLYMDLASVYIENHLKEGNLRITDYQIALLKPKWDKTNKPHAVVLSEGRGFRPRGDQDFEDDPLFREIPYEDILHVRPYIPAVSDEEFFQSVAVYAMIEGEPQLGPVERFCRDFPVRDASKLEYWNYPVFDTVLRKLLQDIISEDQQHRNISKRLCDCDFRVIATREPGHRTFGH